MDKLKSLVIGIGNTLRNDDGIGAYVIEQIELLKLPNIATKITQQLHLEMIEDLLNYKKIIIVDATYIGEHDFILQKIKTSSKLAISSTHHLSLELFINLAKKIYHQDIHLFLCSIKGQNFEIGEKITPEIIACVPKALMLIFSEIGAN